MDFHNIQYSYHMCREYRERQTESNIPQQAQETALGPLTAKICSNKKNMALITQKIFHSGSDVAKCMERRADAITLGKKSFIHQTYYDPFTPRATYRQKAQELYLNITQHKRCLFVPVAQKES